MLNKIVLERVGDTIMDDAIRQKFFVFLNALPIFETSNICFDADFYGALEKGDLGDLVDFFLDNYRKAVLQIGHEGNIDKLRLRANQ